MYSNKYRFVWIGVNKTASSSMKKTIMRNYPNVYKNIVFDHKNLQQTKKKLGRKIWNMYKISMIRNPFDRVTSLYEYRVRKLTTKPWTQKRLKFPIIEKGEIESFKEWIKRLYTRPNVHLEKKLGQQINWISLNNQIQIDYLGYFDNIEKYWEKLCNLIGIESIILQRRNKSKGVSYKEYYDKETYKIIKKVFADDIKLIEDMGYKVLW